RPARGGAAAGRSAAVRIVRTRVFVDIGREAFASLRRNRTRAALSMLGLSWGIVAVVTLLAYGNGFRGALVARFKGAFGDGVTIMFGGQTSMQAGGGGAGAGRPARAGGGRGGWWRARPHGWGAQVTPA